MELKEVDEDGCNKKQKKLLALLVVFLLTVTALVAVMANTAQAALDKQSETYEATLELTNLNVGLTENGDPISDGGELLTNLVPDGKNLSFGKWYDEVLAAKSIPDPRTGTGQPEYVRVVINKFWLDENGSKATNLDPALIELDLVEEGWAVAKDPSSSEQIILYSKKPIALNDSLVFMDRLRISAKILGEAKVETLSQETADTGGTYSRYSTTVYTYDNYKFGISVEVDAVQTHNAADAIKGAWGVDANSLGINVGGAA